MHPQKLIIDTDPGQDIDDLLALLFALLRPELEVVAITTVTLPAARRAGLVQRLLRYLGRSGIPVAAGCDWPWRPLGEAAQRAQQDFATTFNHGAFAEPADPRDQAGPKDAADLIIRIVEQHPGEVGIAAIAPLTNIATALRRRPDLAPAIKYIAMMGGETALNRIEHNVAWDYLAAAAVLQAGVPLIMGTWDVTRRVVLTTADCDRLFHQQPAPLAQALSRAIAQWQPVQHWKPSPVMYDLFPLVWSMDPSYYPTKTMPVQVETQGAHTCGMTVVGGAATHIAVTTEVRAHAVRELYLQTVLPAMAAMASGTAATGA